MGEKNSNKKYEHVLKFWFRFEMKTKKDFHGWYFKWDVVLLDYFEKCRNSDFKNYGLCSSHYLSVSSLSWDVMLRKTKVELEIISDADMYLIFEKDMRGIVSYIFKTLKINMLTNQFTDTDSLMYEIKTEDIYEGFSKDKEMFEFNNHAVMSKYYDDSTKLVVGKIKDEMSVATIREFVELKLKTDSFLVHDKKQRVWIKFCCKNKIKRIPGCFVE